MTLANCSTGAVVLGSVSFRVALVEKVFSITVQLSQSGVLERSSSRCILRHVLWLVDLLLTILYLGGAGLSGFVMLMSSLLSNVDEVVWVWFSSGLALDFFVTVKSVMQEVAVVEVAEALFVPFLLVSCFPSSDILFALRRDLVLFAMFEMLLLIER